jgi:hypothetical protein
MRRSRLASIGLLTCGGCAIQTAPPSPSTAPLADIAEPLSGVDDRDDDPAVVAIVSGSSALCAGALVASDTVLTTRSCVSTTAGWLRCPAPLTAQGQLPLRSARSLGVRPSLAALSPISVRSIVVPAGGDLCSADLAILFLDSPVAGILPLTVHRSAIAQGDHVRTLELASAGALVRDHVTVLASTATELRLGEAGCQSGCGGPVLDEPSGEIVGILSRPDDADEASSHSDVAMRTDAFASWIDGALTQSTRVAAGTALRKTKKGPIDLGANCVRGSDCAAGVCVTQGARRYCSRRCGAHDRCPAHFRCDPSSAGIAVCVQS